MPFLSESITDPKTLRLTATGLATHHVRIRPLSLPVVPKIPGPQHHGVEMRTACMPADYRNAAEAIRSVPVRPDDVWVIGYPGSGTRAVQLLVGELLRDDGEGGAVEDSPLLEQSAIHPRLQRSTQRTSWERIQRLPTETARVLRSHLPYLLLPVALWRAQPRIIYVQRDATDVAADYYREYRLLHGYKGTRAEFAQLWRDGQLAYGTHCAHERDFGTLQTVGVRNVFNVRLDADADDGAIRTSIDQVADAMEIALDDERGAELVRWLRHVLAAETDFRADVATMDAHFKRPATVDFVRPIVENLE